MTVKDEALITRVQLYFEQEGLPQSGPPPKRFVSERGKRAFAGHQKGSCTDAKNYYNAIADDYLEMVFDASLESEIIAAIAGTIEEHKPATVLDAGCGVGVSLGFYASAFPQISFCGSDVSDKMLNHAAVRMYRNSIGNVRLITCDHDDLGQHIAPSSLGMIVAVNTMPAPVFSEEFNWTIDVFWRLLKKDGIFVCVTPPHSFYPTAEELSACLHSGAGWMEFTCVSNVRCLAKFCNRDVFMYILRKDEPKTL